MTWQFFIQLIWCVSIVRSQYEPCGENVAYRKPANQSTTFGTLYASLGVDGRISTNIDAVPCSHTGEGPMYAWWTVDLEGFYFIKFIRIYQWTRGAANRLNGSQMYAKEMDNTWKQINFNSNWPPSVFNVSVELNKPIGEIMLNNSIVQGEAAFICVCELQAFKVIECVPFSIANGSIEVVKYGDSLQNFTFGTIFNVTCFEGYRMSDDGTLTNETESTLECNATGNWSRNLACLVTVCERSLNIPNNSKEIQTQGIAGNNTYNATITVECNEGYKYSLHEIKPLRCDFDGLWRGNLGNCNVIDCGQPLDIPGNSTVVISTGLSGNTSYNATFTIHCNKGFRFTRPGNETLRCGNEGYWTSSLGLCEAIECSVMFVINNGEMRVTTIGVDGRNNTYGAKLAVQCDSGFTSNVPEITCLENGLSAQPVCNAAPTEVNTLEDENKTCLIAWTITGPLCLILLVTNMATCLRFRRNKGFKRKKRNNVPDDLTTAHKSNDSDLRLEAKEDNSAYDFVEDSNFETLKNKVNTSEKSAMEPYDNLQMENRAKSEYDQLAFENESSLKTTIKDKI